MARRPGSPTRALRDHYVVFCRLPELGDKSFGAFVVDADTRGLSVSETISVNAPHVLGTLQFQQCRVSNAALIGEAGAGLQDCAGHAGCVPNHGCCGGPRLCAARTGRITELHESAQPVRQTLAEQQMTQARLADMAVAIDAAALLVYRAAWAKDNGAARVTREAAMAKLFARSRRNWSSTRRCSCTAAAVWYGAKSWSGCTARSARCASTKAPAKSRSS